MSNIEELHQQIAAYAETIKTDPSRRVWDAQTQEDLGFWQSTEWIEGLQRLIKKLAAAKEIEVE